jgi:hypothetical protein
LQVTQRVPGIVQRPLFVVARKVRLKQNLNPIHDRSLSALNSLRKLFRIEFKQSSFVERPPILGW